MNKIICTFFLTMFSCYLLADAVSVGSREAYQLLQRQTRNNREARETYQRRSLYRQNAPIVDYYSKAINAKKGKIFIPKAAELKIVKINSTGVICKFKGSHSLLFVTNINNFSSVVAGEIVACNRTKKNGKQGWQLYRIGRHTENNVTMPSFSLKKPLPPKQEK